MQKNACAAVRDGCAVCGRQRASRKSRRRNDIYFGKGSGTAQPPTGFREATDAYRHQTKFHFKNKVRQRNDTQKFAQEKIMANPSVPSVAVDSLASATAASSIDGLASSNDSTRLSAVLALGRLESGNLPQHNAVVRALSDEDTYVRLGAVRALGTLEPLVLVKHAKDIAAIFDDPDADIRMAAVRALAALEPPALAKHSAALVERIADVDSDVRLAAVLALGNLKQWKLEQLVPAILAHASSTDAGVRYTALEALAELKQGSTVLVEHADAIVGALDDNDADNRLMAMNLLCKLPVADLEPHAHHVVAHLEDGDADVRLTAMRVLSRLEPSALVAHAGAVVQKLVLQTLDGHGDLAPTAKPTGTAGFGATTSEAPSSTRAEVSCRR